MSRYELTRKLYEEVRSHDSTFHKIETYFSEILKGKSESAHLEVICESNDMMEFMKSSRIYPYFETISDSDTKTKHAPLVAEKLLGLLDSGMKWTETLRERIIGSDKSTATTQNISASISLGRKGKEIVDGLRKCCNVYGIEKYHNLNKSAAYFLQLGHLYMDKAVDMVGTKMDQKLNFIRAAVLMNAAIFRFNYLEMSAQSEQAVLNLQILHDKLLQSSVSKIKQYKLIDFSLEIKRKFVNRRLVELKVLKNMRHEKGAHTPVISQIKKICLNNTKEYLNLMIEVIQKCIEIMGDPACEFAVAGLGSLARGEITLSSDFEHVILLADGTTVTENVLEYFRWFTVLFHVIIIGFGETIVPNVDIEGLCDHYDYDIWFRDEYTPCGLSFDGMMPHACKCPLGRQRPTGKYKHVVELIQTSSVMASFLTKEEQLKNGYFLDDVLATNCFVYGNIDVYESFKNHCKDIKTTFKSEEIFQQKRSLLLKAAKARDPSKYTIARFIDVKKFIYRPITVLLHYLACHFDLPSQNSFGILDDLRENEIIDEDCHSVLERALATALEIRMRCYQTKHRQRNLIVESDIVNVTGRNHYDHCQVAIEMFIHAVQDLTYRTFQLKNRCTRLYFPSMSSILWKLAVIRSQYRLQADENNVNDTLNQIKTHILQYDDEQISTGHSYFFIYNYVCLLRVRIFTFMATSRFSIDDDYEQVARHELLDIYYWACKRQIALGADSHSLVRLITSRIHIFLAENKHAEANELLEILIANCYKFLPSRHKEWDRIADLESKVKNKILEPRAALAYFSAACERDNISLDRKCLYKIAVGNSLIRCGRKHDAVVELLTVRYELNKNAKILDHSRYKSLLSMICNIFRSNGKVPLTNEIFCLIQDTEGAKILGSCPMRHDGIPKVNRHKHYKYNFSSLHTVGKYSNFTFNIANYYKPLAWNMFSIINFYSFQIFSSVRYGDMITIVEYILKDSLGGQTSLQLRCPTISNLAKLKAMMALCENVKPSDFGIFEKLLRRASLRLRKFKILQSFLYACFKDYSSHCCIESQIVSTQNEIFQRIFTSSSNVISVPFKTAASCFTRFNFIYSTRISWKLLHLMHGNVQIMEFFLTCVLTIMIGRKRRNPIPHLKLCRELSLKQSRLFSQTLDSDFSSSKSFIGNMLLSSLYYDQEEPMSLLYNLAVDFLVDDQRACAALVWKLLHSGRLSYPLMTNCVYLLKWAVIVVCKQCLQFSVCNRVQ